VNGKIEIICSPQPVKAVGEEMNRARETKRMNGMEWNSL
jgi:hypothetical protein